MHWIESNGTYWKLLEAHGRLWKLMKAWTTICIWNPMEAIRNSKESFVRPKELIWNGGTYIHTHRPLYWVALCATNKDQDMGWGDIINARPNSGLGRAVQPAPPARALIMQSTTTMWGGPTFPTVGQMWVLLARRWTPGPAVAGKHPALLRPTQQRQPRWLGCAIRSCRELEIFCYAATPLNQIPEVV